MNLTVLGLISSVTFSFSPIFIGNRLIFNSCNFNQFISHVIYNPQSLYMKSSTFSNGLNGAIHKEIVTIEQNNYILIQNEKYNKSITKYKDFNAGNSFYSISIIDCVFDSITVYEDTSSQSPIYIGCEKMTVYFTNCLFISCKTLDGIIHLQTRNCEITHCCFANNVFDNQCGVLYSTVRADEDFLFFLYNTIVDCGKKSGPSSCNNVECHSGDQYFRCNNMTDCKCVGFYLERFRCFSFFMNSIINCKSCCILFRGYTDDKYEIYTKKIDQVNMISLNEYKGYDTEFMDDVLIYLATEKPFNMTIIDSVLLSNVTSLFRIKHSSLSFFIYVENCYINEKFKHNENQASFVNCTRVPYNISYIKLLPHYTNDDYCLGPEKDENISAFGCNAGKCVDENCGFTLSFSTGLLPFTTIHYLEIQTATFTAAETFSPTEYFSDSYLFSESKQFSYSEYFSSSQKFSYSNYFSQSSQFSCSQKFKPTSDFTHSNYFSQSFQFSCSQKFTPTSDFTHTNDFSQSFQFSSSQQFKPTSNFTHSNYFSKSSAFVPSNQFSNSILFTKSNQFTCSLIFSPSEIHTNIFSQSSLFSNSISFTLSSIFSSSNTLAPTPSQSDANNIKSFAFTVSPLNVTVKTVVYSYTISKVISSYECIDENSMASFCEIESFVYLYNPYVIFSISLSYIPTFYEIETKIKKHLSGAVIIGIVCGSVTVFFAIIGTFILIKYRKPSYDFSDNLDSSFSDQNSSHVETEQKDAMMNNQSIVNTNLDDDWI